MKINIRIIQLFISKHVSNTYNASIVLYNVFIVNEWTYIKVGKEKWLLLKILVKKITSIDSPSMMKITTVNNFQSKLLRRPLYMSPSFPYTFREREREITMIHHSMSVSFSQCIQQNLDYTLVYWICQ